MTLDHSSWLEVIPGAEIDGNVIRVRQAPPAGPLECAIHRALTDCDTPRDVDIVENLFADDVAQLPLAEQRRIARRFAQARGAGQ